VSSGVFCACSSHLNTCPVGIATQDPELKISKERQNTLSTSCILLLRLREIMAQLGFRTLKEMVGQSQTECKQSLKHKKQAYKFVFHFIQT
jgi:glutamate synthase (ferredoxin)